MQLLAGSALVAIPTETVYGLAGNALDARAVAQIFKVKERPTFDPLIVHTSGLDRIPDFVESIPEKAYALAAAFWPGPLTMVFRKKAIIPDLVTSGMDSVAVRIPRHPLSLQLLQSLDFPLAAPSANPFGYVSPTCARHVDEQLGEKIPYILDGGSCTVGIESTIVGFDGDKVSVLRLGGCKIEDMEKVVGKVQIKAHTSSNPVVPGMLHSHYSPLTPVTIGNIPQLIREHQGKKLGILSFDQLYDDIPLAQQFVLSKKGDLDEAATSLFTGLRQLDMLNLQLIIGTYVKEKGLGRAINDRLRRAEAKRN
ncbi:MAG: threonylcarbamoyl-AMP synthase [Cyclobacteriaceae bacterium]|nr:threonylcarbamoyl-AMP synthase [Cyclobacteriaceae bacterium]